MARDDKVAHLARVPLFANMTRRELRRLAQLADEVTVEVGKRLTTKGRIGQEFFVVMDGEVSVSDGTRQIDTLGPGGFFGEISLLDGRRRTATVRATVPTTVLVVAHREFHALMDEFPSVRAAVLGHVGERLRRLEESAGASR